MLYISTIESAPHRSFSLFPPPTSNRLTSASSPASNFVSHCFPLDTVLWPTCAHFAKPALLYKSSSHIYQMASANAYAAAVRSSADFAATGPSGAQQLDVASRNTPKGASQSSGPHDAAQTSSGLAPSAIAKLEFVEQELIPPTSRLSRVPQATVPTPHSTAPHFDSVAISAFQNNNNTYTSQDVHLFVNSSTSHPPSSAPRIFGQSSKPLETPVSSSSQPSSQPPSQPPP